MVALFQCLLRESLPAFRSVDNFSCLESNVKIAALDGEVKSRIFVFNEMKRDLLLKYIGNLFQLARKNLKLTSGNPFFCKYAMIL